MNRSRISWWIAGFSCLMYLTGCGAPKETTTATAMAPIDYSPRIGVGVSTGARTCMAIHNSALTAGSLVTLISAATPPVLTQAKLIGQASAICPIAQDPDPTLTSYDLDVEKQSIQKLTPQIALLGPEGQVAITNTAATADLEQNGQTEWFRACSANDGVHVTMWSGKPLAGIRLWHGFYYELSNPGIGPACTPAETALL